MVRGVLPFLKLRDDLVKLESEPQWDVDIDLIMMEPIRERQFST